MTDETMRMATEFGLKRETNKIVRNYMTVWDEYYSTRSRESAFLKDLVDSLIGISAVLEVYVEQGHIHPEYALEKLKNSKSYIDSAIRYYEMKEKEENEKNINE